MGKHKSNYKVCHQWATAGQKGKLGDEPRRIETHPRWAEPELGFLAEWSNFGPLKINVFFFLERICEKYITF